MIYLGYAPGGSTRVANKSGVSILTLSEDGLRYRTGAVGCVDDAMVWFADHLGGSAPSAVGIDAFLFWETSRCGWRAADRWLKATYSPVTRAVLPSNSVQGAAAIQGMALGIRLRQLWPAVMLTEAHPKVLYYALSGSRYEWTPKVGRWLLETIGTPGDSGIQTQNEWSALVSAWTAMMGHTQTWKVDLRQQSKYAVEPAGPVAYWWPGGNDPEGDGMTAGDGRDQSKLLPRRFRWKRKTRRDEVPAQIDRPLPAGLRRCLPHRDLV